MKAYLRMNSERVYIILTTTLFWICSVVHFSTQWKSCIDIYNIGIQRKEKINNLNKKEWEQNVSYTVNRKCKFSLLPEDRLAFMCSRLNLGALDLRQQAAVRWLRDERGLYVKRHAVIREMVICLSLLPDGITAQICASMSFWSKTEITATAPICFHAWRLYLLTYWATFASHIDLWPQWSQLKGMPKFKLSHRKGQRNVFGFFCLSRLFLQSITQLTHMQMLT